MKRIIKNILLIIGLSLFVGWLFITPVNKIGISQPYAQPPAPDHYFTAQELNDFVELWNKADNSYIQRFMPPLSETKASQMSWLFKHWLKLHNWSNERFLYCRNKLIAIVKCIALSRNYSDNMLMAKSQNIPLDNILKEQKQKLSGCSFNKKEYDMINKNYNNIISIIPSYKE